LTPRGIEAKGVLAIEFLERKLQEYEEIKRQIKDLGSDIQIGDLPLSEIDGLSDLVDQSLQ